MPYIKARSAQTSGYGPEAKIRALGHKLCYEFMSGNLKNHRKSEQYQAFMKTVEANIELDFFGQNGFIRGRGYFF